MAPVTAGSRSGDEELETSTGMQEVVEEESWRRRARARKLRACSSATAEFSAVEVPSRVALMLYGFSTD